MAVPYGTGCCIAGADGFATIKIETFDDGIVRTSLVHSSEFKSASVAPKTGATEPTAIGAGLEVGAADVPARLSNGAPTMGVVGWIFEG